jgi:hypothetical protein
MLFAAVHESEIGPKRKSRDVRLESEMRTIPDVTLIRRAGEKLSECDEENGDTVKILSARALQTVLTRPSCHHPHSNRLSAFGGKAEIIQTCHDFCE